jgi:hypothetical protein
MKNLGSANEAFGATFRDWLLNSAADEKFLVIDSIAEIFVKELVCF